MLNITFIVVIYRWTCQGQVHNAFKVAYPSERKNYQKIVELLVVYVPIFTLQEFNYLLIEKSSQSSCHLDFKLFEQVGYLDLEIVSNE